MKFKNVLFFLLLAACAPKEKTEPLYDAEDYKFETITLNVETVINDIPPIEPSGIRRFIYKIPILNKILAIPLDITTALLPPLPFNDKLEFSEEELDMWANPEFLSMVQSLKLTNGWLREKSEAEVIAEGKDPGKKSWLCRNSFFTNKGIEFINSLKLIFEYSDRRFPKAPKYEIPLAETDKLDKKHRVMSFRIYDQNVRPFIENFNDFKLKLKAKGGFPCMPTYLQVGFTVQVKLKLND